MNDNSTTLEYITPNTTPMQCEYRMPCGWCKLKNQQCNYIQYIPTVVPLAYPPYPYKVEPHWTYKDITCTGEQNES